MSKIFGKITFDILVDCENESETMALIEANYKINPETMIHWKLKGIDSNGHEHDEITVCEAVDVSLNEFINE